VIADLSAAACRGIEPGLFDHNRFPEASLALYYCQRCAIVEECLAVVRPSKSHFDGVAGAVVWRNGYRVRPDNSTREDRLRAKRGDGE
jgi:hypothetical protein